jgi:catechol 2,3-dioxygenase-like lactoylglutathione lyase family enzyme
MLTRFDHAAIAVGNLEVGMQRYRALGFAVSRGGRHPGHGTENAIIRFALDYLELLAVGDAREAHPWGMNAPAILDFLATQRGGLLGYALASDDLAVDAARLRAFGLPVEGPFDMRRERPDGSVLAWQLAIPGGTPWRRPWPFLIAWETPDAERLAREQPAEHPNGVQGVVGLTVVARDLDAAIALYEQGLGLALSERQEHADLAAEGAHFMVGHTRLDLLAPHDGNGDGLVAQALRAEGEGLLGVQLATADLERTRRTLAAVGFTLRPAPGRADELHLAPEAASGARLVVCAADA